MSAAQYLLAGVACPFLAGVVALGWLRYTAPSRRRRRASKRLIVAITADTSRFAAAMRIAAARMGVAMAEADASLRRFSVAVQRLGDWGVPAWQGSFPPAPGCAYKEDDAWPT